MSEPQRAQPVHRIAANGDADAGDAYGGGEQGSGERGSDELAFLAELLFDPARVEVLRPGRRAAPAQRARLTHAVVRLRRTAVLVPVGQPAAAAAALRRRSAFTTPSTAALGAGMAGAVRLGAGRLATTAGLAVPDAGRSAFGRLARAVLQRNDVVFAAGLGVARPNRKPVVQVLAPDGTVLAFAKVGVSPLSKALVRHEADVLERLGDLDLGITVPRLLGSGEVAGRPVVFQAPVPTHAARGERRHEPPVHALDAIATTGGPPRRRTVLESPWWADTAAHLTADTVDRLAWALRSARLEFAAAHGDFTPWNLSEHAGTTAVWDWERYRMSVPRGFDAAHYAFWARRGPAGGPGALEAARAAVMRSGPVPVTEVSAVLCCYLADLVARFSEPDLERDAEARSLRCALSAMLSALLQPARVD